LDTGWQLKKTLASKISNGEIDGFYQSAIEAGALGGKITGAGGGGFMLLYCPRKKQHSVRAALRELQELPFHLEPDGSKVIFNYRK
jgi:D-glycero-alpha-D-manno-heptose-7-phosphate kinase